MNASPNWSSATHEGSVDQGAPIGGSNHQWSRRGTDSLVARHAHHGENHYSSCAPAFPAKRRHRSYCWYRRMGLEEGLPLPTGCVYDFPTSSEGKFPDIVDLEK